MNTSALLRWCDHLFPDLPVESSEEWNTFYLPYIDDSCKQRVLEGVDQLENRLLLFLEDIKEIRVIDELDDEEDRSREMAFTSRSEELDGRFVEFKSDERWWVYENVFEVPPSVSNDKITRERKRENIDERPARVALKVDEDENLDHLTEGSVHASVFSFLPIQGLTSGMPFMIDADLLTGAGRTKPHEGAAWNSWMMEEIYVTVPEEAEDTLIPQGTQRSGTVYTVGEDDGRNAVFRIETQTLPGSGKSNMSGVPGPGMKEDFETAYDFLKANMHELSPDESLDDHNVNVQVLNPGNADEGEGTSVAFLVGIISGILDRPLRSGLVVLGETSLMGELVKVNSLVDKLQLASDAGAKQVLLPTENKDDLGKVPNELLDEVELLFYRDPINAASKAMNIE